MKNTSRNRSMYVIEGYEEEIVKLYDIGRNMWVHEYKAKCVRISRKEVIVSWYGAAQYFEKPWIQHNYFYDIGHKLVINQS